MFKLNKFTHMLILMTFTIVFVVVYMYYTIKDVKKMYAEVKKNGQDIQNLMKLENDIKEMKGVIGAVMSGGISGGMMPPPPEQFMAAAPQQIPVTHFQAPAPKPSNNIMNDDASVATEDIKKLVEDDDDDDGIVGVVEEDVVEEYKDSAKTDEPKVVQEAVGQNTTDGYTEEQLKKMKFDDLKEIAKKMNISIKGTRDSLITRIIAEKNVC